MAGYFFLWFIFYSFVGWLYESSLYTLLNGSPINSGFLRGPVCPVYGLGAIIGISIFYERVSSLFEIFILSFLIEGCFEFLTGTMLEKIFHKKWWDYSELFLNIKGRVCLLSSSVFGILVVLLIKVIHPAVEYVTFLFPTGILHLIIVSLLILFIRDIVITISELLPDVETEYTPYMKLFKRVRDEDKKAEDYLYKLLRTSKTLSNFMDKSLEISQKIKPQNVSRDYV